jgi:hypothetical protein
MLVVLERQAMYAWMPVVDIGSQVAGVASVAQESGASASASLLQYGAIGAIALLALLAVAKLFARQVAAQDKETARADRLEAELREQNKMIQDKMVVTLTLATEAMARVAAELTRTRP